MVVEILQFLTDHKLIVVGAATTISEVVVVLVNLRRKLKKENQVMEAMSALNSNGEVVSSNDVESQRKKTTISGNLLWAANPINLFRKP